MKSKLPINLNLFTIKLPVHAFVSIAHRASGLFLFLLIPWILWALEHSLKSSQDFASLKETFTCFPVRCLLWLGLCALFYHLLAGIRHLALDFHCIPESLKAGKVSSWIVLGVWALIVLFLTGEILL